MRPSLVLGVLLMGRPAVAEEPLAIPATSRSPSVGAVPAESRPLAIPGGRVGSPPSDVSRRYDERSLSIRSLMTPWGALPYDHRHLHSPWVGVFRGPTPLDVPQTLGVLGDLPLRQQVERRIRNNRSASTVLYGVGAAGIATSVLGLVGSDLGRTPAQSQAGSAVAWAGLGGVLLGFLGGSVPASRARALQFDPYVTLEPSDLEGRVAAYNSRLAREVGLEPTR